MEHLPYQEAFPLPPETPYDFGHDFGHDTGHDHDSEFELPSIDLDDEEMKEFLQSQQPFISKARRRGPADDDEDIVLSHTGHPTVRPAPLKIPGSPKYLPRDHHSPGRTGLSTLPNSSPKPLKQQIIDADGLLVQSILPPHHLRKPKMSFSLPNLVVANSTDFEEALYPSYTIDTPVEHDGMLPTHHTNNITNQPYQQHQQHLPVKKKKTGKKQGVSGGGMGQSQSEHLLARTTGGITGAGVFGTFTEARTDARMSRSSSGARTPLSPSRRSYAGQSVQDIQGQR